ncbi:MAG: tetratricopeptide repeat protein [Candidatus Latescibacteria bacterium]|nr:tetratricopeptide repeat protein [Candidatus Latescibacterota bacterium]
MNRQPALLLGALALLGVFVIENPQCGVSAEHRRLALYYLDQGHYERALVEAGRAVREDAGDAPSYLVMAMAQLGLERPAEAVAALGQAILADPDNPQYYAALRQVCQEEGRFDLGRQALAQVLAVQPENRLAQSSLGWAYAQLDDEAQARQWLEQAAQGDSTATFSQVQLGRLYMRHHRFAEAVQVLEQALRRVPGDLAVLLALGECHLRQGAPEEAQRRFAEALEHSGEPGALAGQIAALCYEQGLRRLAIDYYEQALSQGPQPPSPALLNNLAWTYGEENLQLDRALELSLQAVKGDADNPVYLDTYAELFYKKGQGARAIALMRRALEVEPADGEQRQYLERQLQKFRQALELPYASSL